MYTSKVIRGSKVGKTIGFPTLNIENPNLLKGKRKGVYAAIVKINNKKYQGALYYGPRLVLDEENTVLEIYLFDFHEDIYGAKVSFNLYSFIRGIMDFDSLDELKIQLQKDTENIKQVFSKAVKEQSPLLQ